MLRKVNGGMETTTFTCSAMSDCVSSIGNTTYDGLVMNICCDTELCNDGLRKSNHCFEILIKIYEINTQNKRSLLTLKMTKRLFHCKHIHVRKNELIEYTSTKCKPILIRLLFICRRDAKTRQSGEPSVTLFF